MRSFGLSTGLFIAHYQTYSFPDTSPTVLQFLGGVLCFTQNATAFVAGRLGERFGYKVRLGPNRTAFRTC